VFRWCGGKSKVCVYESAQSVKANLNNRKSLDTIVKGCSNDNIS
jgi:hypothetical protein